jgi:thiamine monophosphate synthase
MYNNLTGKLFSGFYEESLLAAIKSCGKNLVAKGGTSEKNIETTHQLGFHGIAFNSYIWKAKDPLGNFIKIIKKMKELGIEIN